MPAQDARQLQPDAKRKNRRNPGGMALRHDKAVVIYLFEILNFIQSASGFKKNIFAFVLQDFKECLLLQPVSVKLFFTFHGPFV